MDAVGVQRLLDAQQPTYAGEGLTFVGEGWDNYTFRLGADKAVRLPRHRAAAQLLANEQRWMPVIADRLPVSVPRPLATGAPSGLYPWTWTIVEWIEGTTVDEGPLAVDQAKQLARALVALHKHNPPGPVEAAPANPYRGGPLASIASVVEDRLGRLPPDLEDLIPTLTRRWRTAASAPLSAVQTWLHGDLHPLNVLTRRGKLAGLIDWGDLTAGDPATDLAAAWTLLDTEAARSQFNKHYGTTEAEQGRAAGWAIHFGTAMVVNGDARHARVGRRILRRITHDKAGGPDA